MSGTGSAIGNPGAMSAMMGIPMGQASAAGDSPAIGSVAPSAATADPMTQGLLQRFSQMSPEQLQEMVAYAHASPIGQLAAKVLAQKQMVPNATPTPQANAPQAPSGQQGPSATAQQSTMQRGGDVPGMAMGGNPMGIGEGAASPWWTRRQLSGSDSGLLHSAIPGRTDHIPANPAADSFVMPADVVSGLGEGNTLAGAKVLTQALGVAPYGTPMPRAIHRDTIPRPPPLDLPNEMARAEDSTGGPTGRVPILAAGGEFIVPPDAVRRIGGGDAAKGHKVLHEFVVTARKKIIDEMKHLKPPVKT